MGYTPHIDGEQKILQSKMAEGFLFLCYNAVNMSKITKYKRTEIIKDGKVLHAHLHQHITNVHHYDIREIRRTVVLVTSIVVGGIVVVAALPTVIILAEIFLRLAVGFGIFLMTVIGVIAISRL